MSEIQILHPTESVNHAFETVPQTSPVAENISGAVNEVPLVGNSKDATKLKTVEHVKNYPLYQETRSFLRKMPMARVVVANTKPLVKSVMSSKPVQLASPVTNFFDTCANTSLNMTEKVVPSIKTKTYKRLGEEFTYPFRQGKRYTKMAVQGVVDTGNSQVYQPTHAQIVRFRKYYNDKYINTRGKPLVRGAVDPVLVPINNTFEGMMVKYLPNGREVKKADQFCCEMSRSFDLTLNLAGRAERIMKQIGLGVAAAPFLYWAHMDKVINKHLDMKPNLRPGNSMSAVWDAMKELEMEKWVATRDFFLLRRKNNNKETILPAAVREPIVEAVQTIDQQNSHHSLRSNGHEISINLE
ncbi:Sps4p KNAG_0G03220 [Huiozyma naganishii CBS 8797]|uniref:Uncharacterized protein n=1 Tax=Huiozyma naganishii (strain ATCC MYA-139 / BCRC 22969 / CBS 8797 / KCTC 17520 / NBRC 10181 / NCYC 3082 / Yp74L-3) TaxID=1071383 RepID=J7S868_HUIN7|nr:hypothetical protein KNAG_0G03220 [Kazachstania naganishii CBS 8797]CCK71379.1 hypothetical protein KNAG_0G03220 [Kazachstania naganishii CBS 8797]